MQTIFFELPVLDGNVLNIRLDIPDIDHIKKLIIFIHGTGPNTYDNHRKIENLEFNYFDLFAKEFCKRGIAFCRWNTRGCSISDEPPLYVNVDEEEYKSYLPSTSISDIERVINYFKNKDEFKKTKIVLFGISEGTIIAPLVALNGKTKISGLLLAGYANENMRATLEWQLSGGSSMVNMCKWFDYGNNGFITKTDFEDDRYNVRPIYFDNIPFEKLDINGDGIIDHLDFKEIIKDYREAVFHAIDSDDDEWLKNNYGVRITSAWCKEHFNLPPAKEILPQLNIPIHIFHGMDDSNIPVKDVFDIEKQFKELGKENLYVHTFQGHDHDLNYLLYPLHGIISEGIQCIFDSAVTI
ncbi:MAG: alpha/beta hydrolase [Clostridiaceae bacterium]